VVTHFLSLDSAEVIFGFAMNVNSAQRHGRSRSELPVQATVVVSNVSVSAGSINAVLARLRHAQVLLSCEGCLGSTKRFVIFKCHVSV